MLPFFYPKVGTRIADRYELVEFLGAGGMASIFKAIDHHNPDIPVAIKSLHPHRADKYRSQQRLKNEVLLTRKLQHPNIVKVYDFIPAENGYSYVVMQYIDSISLRERLKHFGRFEFSEAVDVLSQIAEALRCAHRQQIIHRNLKPDNILITEHNKTFLTDFALAKLEGIDFGLTLSGQAVGSPFYMSPEQAMGKPLDHRSDIYSFGLTAYELLAGERPLKGESFVNSVNMPIPRLDAKAPWVPKWFASLIKGCTEKQPNKRLESFDEILGIIQSHSLKPETAHEQEQLSIVASGRALIPKAFRARKGTSTFSVGNFVRGLLSQEEDELVESSVNNEAPTSKTPIS